MSELGVFTRFCGNLTLEQGGPLVLEPFQLTLLGDYFDGVVESLILLPKKNGKTTLLSALALYHLCREKDAECVVGAASRDQATILYDQAAGFVARAEWLQKRLVTKGGYRQIRSLIDRGRIRVLAADADTADGVIPTLALVDELHRAKSAGLYGVFRDGLGPRHGRMLTISTAGEHEQTVLGQMRREAHKLPGQVVKGRYRYVRSPDNSFALHEWALGPEDDVDDLQVVKQVNPASWQTIEMLAQRKSSPSMLPWQWARFACGVWTGAESWWIRAEDWQDAASVNRLEPGDRITLGFDGSRYHDATGLVACRVEDGLLQPLGVWESPKNYQQKEWEVPAGEVEAAIGKAMELYRVERLFADPPLWQSEIDAWARTWPNVIRYPTNRSKFMGAIERFRTDLLAGAVEHVDDEVLNRHVMAVATRQVRGGYWLMKSAPAEHIDLTIASILAYEARCDVQAGEANRGEYAFL